MYFLFVTNLTTRTKEKYRNGRRLKCSGTVHLLSTLIFQAKASICYITINDGPSCQQTRNNITDQLTGAPQALPCTMGGTPDRASKRHGLESHMYRQTLFVMIATRRCATYIHVLSLFFPMFLTSNPCEEPVSNTRGRVKYWCHIHKAPSGKN